MSGLEVQIGGKSQAYALLVADTIVVKPGGAPPEVLTAACTKGWSDVAYFFKASHTHMMIIQMLTLRQDLMLSFCQDVSARKDKRCLTLL